ncbi:MAG: prepilin peptidase [Tepidisphaeraceae bacterium]
MSPTDIVYTIFSFIFGACVGSFLNVVAYRVPAGKSIVRPPSACPKCGHGLAAKDNIPILGWLLLRGKCRYCSNPISARYPLVELFAALLFAGTYVLMFVFQWGPCLPMVATTNQYGMPITNAGLLNIANDWPIFVLYLAMIGFLLAASLIDADHFIIPLVIPWMLMGVGIVAHAFIGNLRTPGHLVPSSAVVPLMTIGGAVGLAISIALLRAGVLQQSFAEGEPLLDHEKAALDRGETTASIESMKAMESEPKEYDARAIRREIRHEMAFLLPPLTLSGVGGVIALRWPAIGDAINATPYLAGAIGSLFGALVGALVVWLTRILGSLGFGKEAMGLGDVHLMLGVGAILGAGASTVAFFLAPFGGLLYGVYRLLSRKGHQLPYGPYLAMASVAMIFFYCPIANYLAPGLQGLGMIVQPILQKVTGV